MESIDIDILNWDRFNSKEVFKTPHWFRVNVNIASSESLFGLSPEIKWIWICLLSEGMRKKSKTFNLNISWAAHQWNFKVADIVKAIKCLEKNGLIGVGSESTRSELGADSESTPSTDRQTDKQTYDHFDFEKVYENYPRKLGKKKGIDSCRAQIKTQAEYDSLISAVKRYADHCRKERTEPKYIKHFSSFMTVWTDWVAQDAGKTETAKPAFTPKFVEPSDLDKPFPESNPKVTNMISSLRNKILRGPEEPGSAS